MSSANNKYYEDQILVNSSFHFHLSNGYETWSAFSIEWHHVIKLWSLSLMDFLIFETSTGPVRFTILLSQRYIHKKYDDEEVLRFNSSVS